MIPIDDFIAHFSNIFKTNESTQPWDLTNNLKILLEEMILSLGEAYAIEDGIAVHKTAVIEKGVTLKRPVVVGENCYVGANAYFREGAYLDAGVKIGPGCEIKSSVICSDTAITHFNYIGNSIIGRNVNFEAGSIAANNYNERTFKKISVLYGTHLIQTNSEKFGSLVGDGSRIGANAVLSPGTLLGKNAIVKRLELVEQVKGE